MVSAILTATDSLVLLVVLTHYPLHINIQQAPQHHTPTRIVPAILTAATDSLVLLVALTYYRLHLKIQQAPQHHAPTRIVPANSKGTPPSVYTLM
jgi:hypothetical protein